MRRYMITGATGFIGRGLSKKLLGMGHRINALVRDRKKAEWLEDLGVDLFQGDITRKETLYDPMRGTDAVFHLAAWYKIGADDTILAEDVNVTGTRNVLEVMRDLSIPKGVYTSTITVFSDTRGKLVDENYVFRGKHISEYDRTKWKAHYEVALPMMKKGLPLSIVQPGVVYGPNDTKMTGKMIDRYIEGNLPMVPKGTELCWSYVDDIVDGHMLTMEKGRIGEAYIIAGERHSLSDTFRIAERVTGIRPPRLVVPSGLLKLSSAAMKPIDALFPVPGIYRPETLRVAAGVTYLGSNEKARKELGYSPMTLEEGFGRYLPRRVHELGMDQE